MRATGIVRRVDEIGRIVIPKEIRTTMKIKEGEPMELFVDRDSVILKKYNPNSAADWALEVIELHKGEIASVSILGDKTVVIMNNGKVETAQRMAGDTFDYNVGVAVCLCRHLKIEIPKFV